MDYIVDGFIQALNFIFSMDKEFWGIVSLSLFVSISAVIIGMVVAIPVGAFLGLNKFKGEKVFARLIYTLMSTPTILIGLIVCILLSRRGPLGHLKLLYTPTAIIIAQTILVIPLIIGLTYDIVKSQGQRVKLLAITLGASKLQTIFFVIKELRYSLFINIVTAFSRAISEVGAVMMVGGNIKGQTRVMTTSISMFNSMGDYGMAIGLGLVLLIISLIINSIIYTYKEESWEYFYEC